MESGYNPFWVLLRYHFPADYFKSFFVLGRIASLAQERRHALVPNDAYEVAVYFQ